MRHVGGTAKRAQLLREDEGQFNHLSSGFAASFVFRQQLSGRCSLARHIVIGDASIRSIQIAGKIVGLNTEISILEDKIVALKKQYGDQAFELMADAEANQERLAEIYNDISAKIAPLAEKQQAKLAKRRELQGVDEEEAQKEQQSIPESETGEAADDAPVRVDRSAEMYARLYMPFVFPTT